MKHRITFVTSADTKLDNDTLRLTDKSLTVRQLLAAREDRLTFDFADLPIEVGISKTSQALFVRIHDQLTRLRSFELFLNNAKSFMCGGILAARRTL